MHFEVPNYMFRKPPLDLMTHLETPKKWLPWALDKNNKNEKLSVHGGESKASILKMAGCYNQPLKK